MTIMKGQLQIGDRVELVSCSGCAAGTVVALQRNRIQVVFDDMANNRWLLRPESLQTLTNQPHEGISI
jgi:hypothetical protein